MFGFIGDFFEDVLGVVESVGQPILNVVESVGGFVTENPLEATALALTGYGVYNALAAGGAGAAAGAGAVSEAAFLGADAAQLAAQGLSEAQIAQTLGFAGVDSALATQAAQLAAQGAGADVIAQKVASDILAPSDYGFFRGGQIRGETGLIPGSVEGLQLPQTPGLPTMGGGQGLIIPVEGGLVGATGFTPIGATPSLGDPGSFINDPAVLGQPVIQDVPSSISVTDALRGLNLANQLMGGGQQTATGFPAQQASFQPTGVDYSGILGLLGRQTSVPGVQGLLAPAQIRYPSLLG
jgi:hypothetical protein